MLTGAVIYVAVIGYMIWCAYNGDLNPRECGIAVCLVVLAHVVIALAHGLQAFHAVPFFALVIYLVLKSYGGDVKIH